MQKSLEISGFNTIYLKYNPQLLRAGDSTTKATVPSVLQNNAPINPIHHPQTPHTPSPPGNQRVDDDEDDTEASEIACKSNTAQLHTAVFAASPVREVPVVVRVAGENQRRSAFEVGREALRICMLFVRTSRFGEVGLAW